MPKVRLNPTFIEFRGSVKDITYRQRYGKTFASVKPDRSNVTPSPAQVAHQVRFGLAAAYGKAAMADPTARAFYQQIAKERNTPIFALTIADFMHRPIVDTVDLSEYNGQIGDKVTIKAMDDFGVVKVNVVITNETTHEEVERGTAIEIGIGSGLWHYFVKSLVAAGTEVSVNVMAEDRPGGTAFNVRNKTL